MGVGWAWVQGAKSGKSRAHLNHVVELYDVGVCDAAQDGYFSLQALLELSAEARSVDLLDCHRLTSGPMLRFPYDCKGTLADLMAQHVVIANHSARRGWDVHGASTGCTGCAA